MHNPLLADILRLIQQTAAGTSEYAIHKALANNKHFKQLGNNAELSLFKKHFMVMNALYQLKQQLWRDNKQALRISPLSIKLDTATINSSDNCIAVEHDCLAEYYLDESNYNNTHQEDVKNLLDNFWQRYTSQEQRVCALTTLNLDGSATNRQIELRYRQLVSKNHPDRGGNHEDFVRIRHAYESLIKISK